ncbi:prepilin-type N-terminal cleavage/methylation domain-containing protein [Bacillota bacterium LX-D]|nr:prepilin-type N-terminal cleavage/methylation domain-containing protein [Bacillota bacterium LX-D]
MTVTETKFPHQQGMTLIEIMMAVTVLGIILLFMIQMSTASSRISDDNFAQAQMIELARSEAEKIKANASYWGSNGNITYPPGSSTAEAERIFNVKYEYKSATPLSGQMVTITLTSKNADTYTLTFWLPDKEGGS